MKKFLFTIIAVSFILPSCKKHHDDVVSSKTYITKETYPGTGVFTWSYDAQNNLTNVEFASANEAFNPSYNFRINTLDANGRILEALLDFVSATGTDLKIINVFGTDGKLISEDQINAETNTPKNNYTCTYAANQTTVSYKNAVGVLQFYYVYTFSADGKNVIKNEYFNAAGVVQSTYNFNSFDDKKSPQSAYVPGFAVAPVSANNATAFNFVPASGVSTAFTYTFEYNSDGYTTKRISASGSVSTIEYVRK